jgi:hypothetical protein
MPVSLTSGGSSLICLRDDKRQSINIMVLAPVRPQLLTMCL